MKTLMMIAFTATLFSTANVFAGGGECIFGHNGDRQTNEDLARIERLLDGKKKTKRSTIKATGQDAIK